MTPRLSHRLLSVSSPPPANTFHSHLPLQLPVCSSPALNHSHPIKHQSCCWGGCSLAAAWLKAKRWCHREGLLQSPPQPQPPEKVCRGIHEPRPKLCARSPCSAPREIPPALVREAPPGSLYYRAAAGELTDVINHPWVCSAAKRNREGGKSSSKAQPFSQEG